MTDAAVNLGRDILLVDGDLSITPAGDVAVTGNGRVCLLQDIGHLLDTVPGDLGGHPTYGAGVSRLVGEETRQDFEALVKRAIEDALLYDESVAPRIEPESVVVTVRQRTTTSITFDIQFQPLDEEYTTPENLIWEFK